MMSPKGSATQVEFDDFVNSAKDSKPSKPRPKTKKEMDRLLHETEELRAKRDWAAMTPKHFVALYYALHTRVYNVAPDNVRFEYRLAVAAAMRMLKHQFHDDKAVMVDFMRWVWNREQNREKKREVAGDNSDNSFHITWGYQFGSKLVVDWRISRGRSKARGRQ